MTWSWKWWEVRSFFGVVDLTIGQLRITGWHLGPFAWLHARRLPAEGA